MTESKMSEFFSQAGDAPEVKSVYAVGVYDPADGIIRHMHHVVTMGDSPEPDPKGVEKDAIFYAKNSGQNLNNPEVIHIDDFDPTSVYRVDVTTKKLEKVPISFITSYLKGSL